MSLGVLHVAVKADQHRRCAPLGRRMNEVPPVRLSRNGLGRRRFAHGPSYRLFRRPFVRLVSALPLMRFRRAGSACWPLLARFVNPLFPAILEITLPRCGDVCLLQGNEQPAIEGRSRAVLVNLTVPSTV